MIEVVNVVKYYDNRAVVNNVSFTINDGSFVSIVGKSGSGKTTLINMIGAMLLPDSGKILIDGKDIISLNDKEVALYRNKSIGFVFQNSHLEPTYSVYENITLPMEISGNRRNLKNRAKEVLDMVGMNSKNITMLNVIEITMNSLFSSICGVLCSYLLSFNIDKYINSDKMVIMWDAKLLLIALLITVPVVIILMALISGCYVYRQCRYMSPEQLFNK